ncbi:MAG: sigma-54-dependent Fis family transcriptional regulator [Planctomycetota bacterium]|nr:sigma-54-dependent Fis family transcriptional regulator [Planctomycetota bacterium]
MKPTILVVDDEELVRWSLRQRLEAAEYQVVEASTGEAAIEHFRNGVDLVLLDYGLPDTNGIDVLMTLRSIDPDPPVILLTAHSSVERAVEAMQKGAYHYARKPFNLDDVAVLVERALETTRLRREVRSLQARDRETHGFDKVVGESPEMRHVKALLRKIAVSPASTVLLTGESGTGKDVAARAIHAQSDRSSGPFMNITCSALPETLLESELFGHERGAFTDAKTQKKGLLEQADQGTVFLDEIAEMSPTLQAKLLRFLEEKAFRRVGGRVDIRPDVRIIAATHRDLQQDIAEGRFRADLYYRLAVLSVHLPPLRDRADDIELLAKYFVDRFNREFHRSVRSVSRQALKMLQTHPWPGNIRELRNAIERAVLLSDGDELTIDHFQFICPPQQAGKKDGDFRLPPGGIVFQDLERELMVQALERARGNQTRAAELLGMTRDQIRYRIAKFKLNDSEKVGHISER